jgi:UDP-3-O-[3-hydroxymyristoyl] glucosamine N-acyltransferase
MKQSQSLCISLQELADFLGAKLEAEDPKCKISGLATLECAGPGQLSFLTNRAYRGQLLNTRASAVLLSSEDANVSPVPVLISDNPRLSLAKVASLFESAAKEPIQPGIHPSVIQGKNCQIHPSVSIAANCVLGDGIELEAGVVLGAGCVIGSNCRLGENTIIKPKVVLYERVNIGKNCIIHSGTVIGCDGFGYAFQHGSWIRMPHLAGVSIGDGVEIGANCEIDRGFIEDTRIGSGVIIGSLVVVGHNVVIGDHCAIAGCSGIAGSTTIGKNCMLGGGVSIAGHLNITDNVHITATASIHQSINTPGVYSSGVPAKPNHIWRKNAARFQYLDDMARRLKVLENKLL